jgi:hypothetical protein
MMKLRFFPVAMRVWFPAGPGIMAPPAQAGLGTISALGAPPSPAVTTTGAPLSGAAAASAGEPPLPPLSPPWPPPLPPAPA